MTDEAIALLAPQIGTRAACAAAGVAQATWYRRHRTSPAPPRPAPVPHRDRVQPRALAVGERKAILEALHSSRFADLAPDEVWAILLDEGAYLGSVSTYYRVLREAGESRERRAQATHPADVKPELVATGPNQVCSWDITKLHGPAKWTYYHLYVILDIFSRYVVGWMVATSESAVLAEKLIAATCAQQGIVRGQLTLHADRGSSMTSKPVALLLADLGVTQTHSRPARLQRQPVLRGAVQDAQVPAGVPGPLRLHRGRPGALPGLLSAGTTTSTATAGSGCSPPPTSTTVTPRPSWPRAPRSSTAAYRAHPERFVSKPPTPPDLPGTSRINPPQEKETVTQ